MFCLSVGVNVDTRGNTSQDSGLPVQRSDRCTDDTVLVNDGTKPMFAANVHTQILVYKAGTDSLAVRPITLKITAWNEGFTIPREVTIKVKGCGEPNAFYDPDAVSIIRYKNFLAGCAICQTGSNPT